MFHILIVFISQKVLQATKTRKWDEFVKRYSEKELVNLQWLVFTWLVVSVMVINIFSRAIWSRLLMPIRYSSFSSSVPAPSSRLSIICWETSRPSSASVGPDHTLALSALVSLPRKLSAEWPGVSRGIENSNISNGYGTIPLRYFVTNNVFKIHLEIINVKLLSHFQLFKVWITNHYT